MRALRSSFLLVALILLSALTLLLPPRAHAQQPQPPPPPAITFDVADGATVSPDMADMGTTEVGVHVTSALGLCCVSLSAPYCSGYGRPGQFAESMNEAIRWPSLYFRNGSYTYRCTATDLLGQVSTETVTVQLDNPYAALYGVLGP